MNGKVARKRIEQNEFVTVVERSRLFFSVAAVYYRVLNCDPKYYVDFYFGLLNINTIYLIMTAGLIFFSLSI